MAVIVERSAGNPFFAIQLALSLAENGVLDRAERGRRFDGRAVDHRGGVALLERVFPLGENARTVARFATRFSGTSIWISSMDLACGRSVLKPMRGRGRVRPPSFGPTCCGPSPEVRYEFVHDLVRETLYGDLGPAERRRLHGAAAQVLLKRRAHGTRRWIWSSWGIT